MFTRHIPKLLVMIATLSLSTQLPANDWRIFGGDAQRTGWAKDETILTKKSVAKLKLLYRVKLDNAPKFMTGLTAPVIMESVIIPRSHGTMTDIVIVGGSSDKLFAVDADAGTVVWQRAFTVVDNPKIPTYILCPKALNATPAIEGVGWLQNFVYAIASDGKLYTLDIHTGTDAAPPLQFVPPFSKPWSLNIVDRVVYTATSQGCGQDQSAVYALDLRDPARTVKKFNVTPSGGGGIWGRAGVAAGMDGTVYAETGDGPWNPAQGKFTDSILALTHKDLQLRDYYTPQNRDMITRKDFDMSSMSPVVFPFNDQEIVAASGKEGVIYLLDAGKLGGEDHRTPLLRSLRYANAQDAFSGHGMWGAFATWVDENNARWLAVPVWGPIAPNAPKFSYENGAVQHGAIMALKVSADEPSKKPTLIPAWTSRDMQVPEPPVFANGLIFGLSNGANVDQMTPEGKFNEERHKHPRSNAVLYALDADTGKELWSSGDTITSWTHFSGLAIANGRVFVTTWDGTLWIFGIQ